MAGSAQPIWPLAPPWPNAPGEALCPNPRKLARPSSPASTKARDRLTGTPSQSGRFWRTVTASSRTSGRRSPPELCSTAWYQRARSAAAAIPPPPGLAAARRAGWLKAVSASMVTSVSGSSSTPRARASSAKSGSDPTGATSITPEGPGGPGSSQFRHPAGSSRRSAITSR